MCNWSKQSVTDLYDINFIAFSEPFHWHRISHSICSHSNSNYCKSSFYIFIETGRHSSSTVSSAVFFLLSGVLFMFARLLCRAVSSHLWHFTKKRREFRHNTEFIYTMLLSSNWLQSIDIDTIQYIKNWRMSVMLEQPKHDRESERER